MTTVKTNLDPGPASRVPFLSRLAIPADNVQRAIELVHAEASAKLDFITVTQAVDLDTIEARVNALDAAVVLKGAWDASAGTFPGAGVAQAGWSYIVSVAGTVDGVAFVGGDRIVCILDNGSTTTYASNWLKLDYTDQVSSVAGRTGAVTLTSSDLTDTTAYARTLLDDADASAARTTLGLGTMATETAANYLTTAAVLNQIRERLTAARTYYVRTDGSDSNTGLAGTSGAAFLTIQKAIDTAAALDSSIYDVTISVADGSYSTSTGLVLKTMAGAGAIYITGNTTTPANVTITTSGAMTTLNGVVYGSSIRTTYYINGFTLTSTSSGTVFGLLSSGPGSFVRFQNIVFGTGMTQQLRAEDGAALWADGNYAITGGAAIHSASVGNAVIRVQNRTITLTGTLAFAYFAQATTSSVQFLNGNTYDISGATVTGTRYDAYELGMIKSNGAGASYLPGNVAGSPTPGSGSVGGEYY